MTKQEKQIRKLVFNQLDLIIKTCEKISKKWKRKSLPLITIDEILKRSKLDQSNGNVFEKNYNKLIDTLGKTCHSFCKKINVNRVPLSILEAYIDEIKRSFDRGLNE